MSASAIPSIDEILSGDSAIFTAVLATVLAIVIATVVVIVKKGKKALDPTKFVAFPLVKKEVLSHDTARFVFGLQTPQTKLGLPIGQHIVLRFKDEGGKHHQRRYTPVSGDETLGTVAFVIKVYRANTHPKFPRGGMLSQHLDSLSLNDTIEMKGPEGHLTYLSRGRFTVQKSSRTPAETRTAAHFGMVAGGTGITPMLQVLRAIFGTEGRDDGSGVTASLLYANQTEGDILVRKELEELAWEHGGRFRLRYTIDRPEEGKGWKGGVGFVSREMIEEHVLSEGGRTGKEATQILMCGPPAMLKFACEPALKELEYGPENTFTF